MFWITSLFGILKAIQKKQFGSIFFFLYYMVVLKKAILAVFQTGQRWPCPVSAALKNAS
jgi:hypothetical protein